MSEIEIRSLNGHKLVDETARLEIEEIKINGTGGGVGQPGTGAGAEIFNDYTYNVASGECSHAEGMGSKAIGNASHAEGMNKIAFGDYSHAEGYGSSMKYYHANYSILDYDSAIISLQDISDQGSFSNSYYFVVGNRIWEIDNKIDENTIQLKQGMDFEYPIESGECFLVSEGALGHSSHAEGYITKAIGQASHAEGQETKATGHYSHAEGLCAEANGNNSHAEGWETKAVGNASHAEGYQTKAYGESSHAEGEFSQAEGRICHAEGIRTVAIGLGSHSEGYYTEAISDHQHVQGKYNILDDTSAHIVGNGTDYEERSNAHTLDWQGNAWYSGDVYVGSTSGTNRDEGSKKLATEEYVQQYLETTILGGAW